MLAKGDQADEDKLDELLKTMKTDFMVRNEFLAVLNPS